MINWLRKLCRGEQYRVTCPACGAASNPTALDLAGLWAALHAHLCPGGVDGGDLAITHES
jgi:hypothetical protein